MADRSAIELTACDLGASVWLIRIAGRTVLFDAWLDDPYVSRSPRFFEARRKHPPVITTEKLPLLDLVILSSPEQDHCHPVTLAALRRDVPVCAHHAALPLLARLGFSSVTALSPGAGAELFGGDVSLLALRGYGNNLPIVLRDNATDERLCIAQHGIHVRWLRKRARSLFAGAFSSTACGRAVDALCLGTYTTLLRPRFVPSRLLPDRGTIVPDLEESAAVVELLRPARVLFAHMTPEHEEGWAVRHLLEYPTSADPIERATRALRARAPSVRIDGLPAPGEVA